VLFSKGLTGFRSTYELHLNTANIGGLSRQAKVLMAGVEVGKVDRARLAPDGRKVTVVLRIYEGVVIYHDARFLIEQSGFLGDQYVAIIPTENQPPVLQPGDEVEAGAPFNLQEAAREAAGFIRRIDETAQRLNDAIVDVRRLLLNQETLTNLALTIGNFREVSAGALVAMDRVNSLVESNTPSVSTAVSNLSVFSERLSLFGQSLQDVLATNTAEISSAIRNIETSTVLVTNLLSDLNSARGLAGQFIKNERLAADVNRLAHNLAITSSNLNALGLWRVLWKPKPPPTNEPPAVLHAPKHPYP
jgi:phospholipid/cholesterol/gamma-HCH transport system substrate-binding protein